MNINHYRHFADLKEQHKTKQAISFADTGFFLRVISQANSRQTTFTIQQLSGQFMARRHVINTLDRLTNINALAYQVSGEKITITFNSIFYGQ